MDLNIIWFLLVGILFTGYAVLDGFDFGVGTLHLLTRKDEERRIMFNAIGPVWDGNEVWLVTGGGALFAAFPNAYATVFSGFYLPFMLLLLALIFRAVAIEFRSKQPMKWWRDTWDISFFLSSILSSFLIGVTIGNLAWGIPLNEQGDYIGGFWRLIHPYSIGMGITTIALFTMHGAIYLAFKTEGDLQKRVHKWIMNAMIAFIICYVAITMATLLYVPHMTAVLKARPFFFVIPLINLLAIANIPRAIYHNRNLEAFLSSCAAMVSLMALFAIGMFPNMVVSNPDLSHSLNIYNAASSATTLKIMLVIAGIGMPLVLGYTTTIYWIFRGKVKIEPTSY